jgi:hypothetical protein
MTDIKAQQRLLDQRKLVAKAAAREEMAREARDSLIKYIWFTMPHPSDPDDVTLSRYTITPQARLLCQIIEKIARGEPLTEHGDKNAAISIGPQTGKSEIISRRGPAWLFGRNPSINVILGSYNQDFANEFGDDVGAIIRSDQHRQVFPGHTLRKGGNAKDLLISTDGGKLAFVGVGGSGTGKPADVFIVDDPIRNDDDAQSETYRERTWNWFTKVASTRIHNDSAMCVVHTRWSEDDLIGRLCDPEHPERGKKYAGVAEDWLHINIPAIVEDPALAKALGLTLRVQQNDLVRAQFGTKPIAALWPERFSLEFLAKQKRLDKRGFTALRMGKPAPEDGDYFKADWLVPYYSMDDLPKRLQMYGSSDHAATEKRKNDASVIGCVGVDEKDDIWVMPDLIWDRKHFQVVWSVLDEADAGRKNLRHARRYLAHHRQAAARAIDPGPAPNEKGAFSGVRFVVAGRAQRDDEVPVRYA